MTHLPPGFDPGGRPDRPDSRDLVFGRGELAYAAAPFDWTKGCDVEAELGITVQNKNQGSAGSCGGEAMSYYAAILEYVATKTFEERSARFVYCQTYVPPDGGTTMRDLAALYTSKGIAREAVFTSYDNGKPPSEAFMRSQDGLTDVVREDAKKDIATSYATVPAGIDLFASAIAANHGMILGLDGEDNGTWLSAFPKAPSKRVWGHWLYACKAKLIKGKKYIGVRNSWGDNVGENGIQWLGEDYFNSGHIWPGWTHILNTQGIDSGFHHTFNTDMKLGAKGEEVRNLQRALQADGSFPPGFDLSPAAYPNPTFADMTRTAVRKFQLKYGVCTASNAGYGVCGPKTRAQLNKLFA